MLAFLKNLLGGGSKFDLNGAEFKALYHETPKAVLLDVRTAAEFSGGTLPKAKNLDMMGAGFAQKAKALGADCTYFVFCRSGARSGRACNAMAGMGLKVHNLSGGIGGWPR